MWPGRGTANSRGHGVNGSIVGKCSKWTGVVGVVATARSSDKIFPWSSGDCPVGRGHLREMTFLSILLSCPVQLGDKGWRRRGGNGAEWIRACKKGNVKRKGWICYLYFCIFVYLCLCLYLSLSHSLCLSAKPRSSGDALPPYLRLPWGEIVHPGVDFHNWPHGQPKEAWCSGLTGSTTGHNQWSCRGINKNSFTNKYWCPWFWDFGVDFWGISSKMKFIFCFVSGKMFLSTQ